MKTIRKYLIFAIIAIMAYFLLQVVLLLCSTNVYETSIYTNGKYDDLCHKSISCKVIKQNIYKEHRTEKLDEEYSAFAVKASIAEQTKCIMCWHCTWKPIIIYGFFEVVLFALLCIIVKEKRP